jgi:hypothetical protein
MITKRDLLILDEKIEEYNETHNIYSVNIAYAVIGALNIFLYDRAYHIGLGHTIKPYLLYGTDIEYIGYLEVVNYLKLIGANDILKKNDDIEDGLKVCAEILFYYVAQNSKWFNYGNPIVERYVDIIRKHKRISNVRTYKR